MIALTFPRTDSGLLAWSQNFLNLITATPTAYNLVAGDATAYLAVHTAYSTALANCDPGLRSAQNVITKNAARTTLKNSATLLANKVYSGASVTDAQKTALGIPPRRAATPIPPPSTAPVIEVLSVSGWTVKLKLKAVGGTPRRGKPAGVSGASVFTYVGATPPDDIPSWKFEGNTGRSNITVEFPSTLAAGTKVWMTAFWFNGRKQSGPACAPVATYVQYGAISQAA